ncbi:unnamed protein product [Durusdinium trenchii]|uniref:Uncharacterized protein n=1 Tax=Durusdinium trenchii TaxID=1381693 RepID=A0ABP0KSG6_9DINO
MASPSGMPPDERKKQYSAMRRAIVKTCEPALLAKFQLASDGERWSMLKQWLLNDGKTDSITVEEKFTKFVEQLRTDRYVTVTKLQLQKMYGKSKESKAFIAELIKGQAGTPHPQAPNLESARMYKVLREIAECTSTGSRSDHALSTGGRVRDEQMKAMISKQLGVALGNLEEQGLVDLKTGRIAGKKAKKQKTPEQLALGEVRTLGNKFKRLINDIPSCINEITSHDVRNSEELVRVLRGHEPDLESRHVVVLEKLETPVSAIDADTFMAFVEDQKPFLTMVETDVRDAKRRVANAKGPKKRRQAA